jgi:hypothetical protein
MVAKKTSPELKAKMALVAAAARELKPHYFTWIVDAATDEFRDRLRKTEHDIVRHAFFADRPEDNNLENALENRSRHEVRQRLEETRTTYRDILKFLRALQVVAAQIGAEDFAEGMREHFHQKIRFR